MIYRRIGLCAAALALASASRVVALPPVPVSHPAPSHRIVFDPHKFMRVSELRPGMRGYALTTFKGTKIEKFGIEILGVVEKFNNGKDYVLFRALDGPSVTRHLNVAHGMSGSPIYIKGRLVGAISMSMPFGRDPIGFATPIEEMLDAWNPDLPAKPESISATAADSDSSSSSASPYSDLASLMHKSGVNGGSSWTDWQPIDLPVTVSGLSAAGVSRFASVLAPYHLRVTGGGGMASSTSTNVLARGAKLVPGAAVGVSLVQGDVDVTATGTVTYRDGNRILIFGHPFTNLGPVDAALTTAYVVDIFPSFQDSMKLGSPIKTVGRIFQDRPFSVGGIIGSQPDMVPMTVSINDESIKRQKVFNVRVINHPLLTAQFISAVADQAIAQVHGQPGDSVATVKMDVDIEEIGHVTRTNTFYDAMSIDQSAISDLDGLMHLLSSNPFYPLAVKSVKFAITIQNRHDTAEIDHIVLKKSKYAPGDTVDVGVVLKPYKRDFQMRTISVKIPSNTPSGTLNLSVRGGGSEGGGGGGINLGGLIIMRGPSESNGPAATVAQLVKKFIDRPRNNELVARLALPTSAINISGEKLSSLPPTISGVMQATRSTGLKTERDEVKVIKTLPYIVSGSQTLSITVEQEAISGAPRPAPAPAPSTPPAPPAPVTAAEANQSSDDSDELAINNGNARQSLLLPVVPIALAEEPSTKPQEPAKPQVVTVPPAPAAPTIVPAAATAAEANQKADKTEPPVKTVGRLARIWRQTGPAEFGAGSLTNVSVTSAGDLRLAPSLSKIAEIGETYSWSVLKLRDGPLVVGTGDRGIIYKIGADGKAIPFFKTGQLEVNALTSDEAGNIYAGTTPHGIVYKITPDGHGSPWFKASSPYITSLAYDAHRARIYVATGGGSGKIYAVPVSGAADAQAWYTTADPHILCLALDNDGNVYAGTSPNGIVYKITPAGDGKVLYDASQRDISALATDSMGRVYVGTNPHGTIYRIDPNGTVKTLLEGSPTGFLAFAQGAGDTVYACSGSTVYKILPDETIQVFVTKDDAQILSLTTNSDGTGLYAGTATLASVYQLTGGGKGQHQGEFESSVLDAGRTARWGNLAWLSDTPAGSSIVLHTRSGDEPRPDGSWSAWSDAYTNARGQKITSPAARYLQYQVLFQTDKTFAPGKDELRLHEVSAYFLPRNQSPSIKLVSPKAGDAVSKSTIIQWTATDPDNDTLAYDVTYSSDNGATWKPVHKKEVRPGVPAVEKAPTSPATGAPVAAAAAKSTSPGATVTDADIARETEKMRKELDKHPELTPAAREHILSMVPGQLRNGNTFAAQEARKTSPASQKRDTSDGSVRESSLNWDTSTIPDGVYQIQVVASDRISNPQGPLTDNDISAQFVVANKPPVLGKLVSDGISNKTAKVHGTVTTGPALIKSVQYRIDKGDPNAAYADDGLFDSSQEDFTLVTRPLSSGPHTIEVQAVDRAGNTVTKEITVTVP